MLKIIDEAIDLNYYKKAGIIADHFPLHDDHRSELD